MSASSILPDRLIAERIIAAFYARLKKPEPRFLWLDGPVSCVFAWHLLRSFDWLGQQADVIPVPFKRPSGGRIGSGLWLPLSSQLEHQINPTIDRLGLADSPADGPDLLSWFWGSFWSQFEPHIGSQLGNHLRDVMHKYFDGDVRRLGLVYFEGGFWGGEVESGLSFARQCLDKRGSAAQLNALQRACGWWLPCERVVFCSDQPRRIQVDARGRLHSERGPTLQLSNDHRLYFWHGTRVPIAWIEQRDTLDPSIALTWQNAEQRRAASEIIGWAKVIERLPVRVIHVDRDPQIGTLLECDLPHARASRFLRVRCGTGRDFALSVPREMTTARQANAWTYGLTDDEYQPEVRA